MCIFPALCSPTPSGTGLPCREKLGRGGSGTTDLLTLLRSSVRSDDVVGESREPLLVPFPKAAQAVVTPTNRILNASNGHM